MMSSQTNERAFESMIEKALDIKENGGGFSKDVAIFRTGQMISAAITLMKQLSILIGVMKAMTYFCMAYSRRVLMTLSAMSK